MLVIGMNLQTRYSDMKHVWLFWTISIVSLVLSVAAVCVAAWRSPELSFDYQGVIVGVLSMLVTVLIGWNIYTLVDLKGVQSKMRALSEDATRHINGNMTISEGAHFMIYHYLLTGKDPLGIEYRFIYHGVASLVNASQYGDILMCNAIVKAMLECIARPERITVTASGKADVIKLISLVRNVDKIEGFLELARRIALLNVDTSNS